MHIAVPITKLSARDSGLTKLGVTPGGGGIRGVRAKSIDMVEESVECYRSAS